MQAANQMQTFPIQNHMAQNYILQVSELTLQIKSILESEFNYVEVEGEISNYKIHTSGHIYFNLKDDAAVISCTLFRGNAAKIKIPLKNGDKIIVKGSINLYMPKGEYNINVFKCEYSGLGDLKMQFEKLKNELESKGYFNKNKPLPKFPKRIILLTSASGAALQDMIKVASARFCGCEFILINTMMQGREAKFSISRNLNFADNLGADIIVLARGGGSIEDLWSFNEIEVLESIYACKTPVVSAIGHESDYLLSDYVADLRAPTPSAAMQMILQDKNTLIMQLMELENTLLQNISVLMRKKREAIEFFNNNIKLLNPSKKIINLRKNIADYDNLLKQFIQILIERKKQNIRSEKSKLEIIKPTSQIQKIKLKIQNLQMILNENIQKLFAKKSADIINETSNINNTLNMLLVNKKAMCVIDIDTAIKSFIYKKKMNLNSIEEIIKNINPQHSVKKGYVQILKDNKIMEVKDLKQNDEIEIIDISGIANARIL